MTLNLETAALMAEFAKSDGKPLEDMTPDEARTLSRDLTSLGLLPDTSVTVTDSRLAVSGGDILLRTVTPASAPIGVIVFFHGGGWVIGSAEEWESVASHLATASGCTVVLPDYRKAPEHPFPTPVEDCWTALTHIAQTTTLPLMVCGDSAGGNLAAVMALRARDQNGPTLRGQILIYPVTDHDPQRPSWRAKDKQLILTAEGMTWFWDHYIAKAQDRLHPDASPLRAKSHDRLPPTFLLLAEHDILHDEGAAYADRLVAAGNDVTRTVSAGDTHGFLTLGSILPSATRAIAAMGVWVRQHLAK
ncbi:MAG: alpha/beta hydrolase [bacterium]